MPVELQVIRASEFVRLDPGDNLDFEASKEALRTLAQACRKRGLGCAVLDLRELPIPAKPQFTKAQLGALVAIFRDAGFLRHQRLAVLYSRDVHGGIRDFAFIGRMRGLQVQAFTDYEAAMLWLSEGENYLHTQADAAPVALRPVQDKPKKLRVKRGNGQSALN
jgi:hypothetical protein